MRDRFIETTTVIVVIWISPQIIHLSLFSIFFKWADPGLFFIYFRLFIHTLQTLQQNRYVKKYPSIQHTVPGFELMTFET